MECCDKKKNYQFELAPNLVLRRFVLCLSGLTRLTKLHHFLFYAHSFFDLTLFGLFVCLFPFIEVFNP